MVLSRRRALVVGLAGLMTACAGPQPAAPTPSPQLVGTAPPLLPTVRAVATPTPPPATPPATPPPPSPTPTVAPAQPSPTPTVASDQVAVAVRLWNGSAEVQLDGRTVQPGNFMLPRGQHQAAALVDGDVVSIADVPAEGGSVDLVVPPPLASLAIMVENQADARPQTGLTQADVVYEALAEGGITRFIALYLSGDSPVVGPVRSLRHYFAFMAADYRADVVHIGASPEGFAWRDAMHMGHLDESAGDPGVWRVRTRPPPHNAYTATAADRGFLHNLGWQQHYQWGPLLYSEHAPVGEDEAHSISLRFGPWPYRVDYLWDASEARYLRSMEGNPHRDAASGEWIAPATVVVQFAEVDPIPNDEKLRLDVDLVGGNGDLLVFSDGTRREGTWSKGAPSDTTSWLDDDGQPMVIQPGPVWVEVVPLDSPISYSA
jgi:Protein of unknown function (DUF3048) N-terminal domain/Protein of unknown function (DUF3048) C-terminal domain